MIISQQELDRRLAGFRRHCAEHGLASTHQRQVIYVALASSDSHPTPEAIYARVRRRMPSISLATVYKNIRTFLDIGLLSEVTLLHQHQRLDANLKPHHHLICARCQRVQDISQDKLQAVRWKGVRPSDFHIQGYKVEVMGICRRCARRTRTSTKQIRRKSRGKQGTQGKQNA